MTGGFVAYQIEFSAVAAGKRVSSSKRKIRWRFGFANQQALANGMVGTECRGEEHDVTIVWSITSGKRQIMMDGQEVHYSTNRGSVLDFTWQSKGNHVMKVFCHATPPMSAQPGFRQYDMSIDGQSFYSMPKVFQIGIKGAVPDPHHGAYGQSQMGRRTGSFKNLKSDAPLTREQEDADLRRAIEASITESRQHLERSTSVNPAPANGGPGQTNDLLGFAGSSGVPAMPPSDARSVTSYYTAPPTYDQGFSSPPAPSYPTPAETSGAIVPAVAPAGYYQAPSVAAPVPPPTYAAPAPVPPPAYAAPAPVPPPTYAAPAPVPPVYSSPPPQQPPAAFSSPPPVPPAPAPTPDVFGIHAPQVEDPFAPKPATYQDLTNAVMGAYNSPSPQRPAVEGTYTNGTQANGAAAPNAPQPNGSVTLSMNALSLTANADEKPKSAFEKALSNLVNIDHIDEPAEGELKLTMMRKEEAKKAMPKGKSVPKPPAGIGMIGSNAPLSQIRKDFKVTENKTSDGIMNAPPPGVFHPNAAQGGALVVHGQGPPPLQQAQGFGVGAMLPNGGFQNQQNLAPGQYMQQQRLYQ